MMAPTIINGVIAIATRATFQEKINANIIPPIIEDIASAITPNASVLAPFKV